MTKFYLSLSRYLTVLLFLVTTVAWSQSRTVTGKVTSAEDGTGLPGVNVIEKGTNNGTATDVDGNFSLNVGDNATLVFSFVGYSSQEVAVANQTTININLASDVTSLSEVVVVGYGTQERKEITSSVVSLKPENFNRGNVNDPTQLLQGKVAGLSISKPNSDPNGNYSIRLRGLSTIGANAQPLIVIDGVIGASLNSVDPNDIASIDVLKDGSAAAIYGSRGSSGVILISTKKGKAGKPQIEYNGYLAMETIAKSVPVLDRAGFLEFNGNDFGSDTDWIGEVTQTGVSNVHNLSFSGGAEGTTYRFAVNYRDINGILRKSGFDQLNARLNLTQRALNDRLTFTFDAATTTRNSDFSFTEALRYAVLFNPTSPVRNPDGTFFQAILFDNYNPVAIIEQNVNEGKTKRLNFSGKVDLELVEGLTATASYSQQRENEVRGEYYPRTSFFRGFNRSGLARRSSADRSFDLFESYLNYSKNVGELNVSATAGYSFQKQIDEEIRIEAGDFPTDDLGYHRLEWSKNLFTNDYTNLFSSSASPESKIIAFFGRINLNWKEGVFFNASLRREGSTKLGAENQWGVFPALGAGVDVTKFVDIGFLDLLKVRVGYGVTGSLPNQNGLSQKQYTLNYQQGEDDLIPVFTQSFAENPDLKWETKSETNFGIDFSMLQNKLQATIDIYQRDIEDFILNRPVETSIFGAPNRWENTGKIQTRGWEVALNYAALSQGSFTWNTGLVLSHYKSILKAYPNQFEYQASLGAPGQNDTNLIRVDVGEEIGRIWGYEFSGYVTRDDPATDTREDGQPLMVAADGTLKRSGDMNRDVDGKVLGYGLPDLEVGWTNQVNYKNWDFNIFFRAAFGHSLVNTYRAFYEPIIPGQINSYNRVDTKYSVQKPIDGESGTSEITDAKFSSYYVEKGDFLKLDNLTIGYNFNIGQGKLVSKLRAYFIAQNPFVITGYTGVDPEVRLEDFGDPDNGGFQGASANPLAPGLDRRNNYFRSRTFTLGVTIGL